MCVCLVITWDLKSLVDCIFYLFSFTNCYNFGFLNFQIIFECSLLSHLFCSKANIFFPFKEECVSWENWIFCFSFSFRRRRRMKDDQLIFFSAKWWPTAFYPRLYYIIDGLMWFILWSIFFFRMDVVDVVQKFSIL